MIPEWLGSRIREVIASYRWLWRAAHASTSTRLAGVLRFAACAVEDALALGVWCIARPIRRPSQRDRVVVPAAVLAVAMMLSVQADRTPTAPGDRAQVMTQDVGERCGGSVYLGAIAAPGDVHVAFAACSDAVADAADCLDCMSGEASSEVSASHLRLTI